MVKRSSNVDHKDRPPPKKNRTDPSKALGERAYSHVSEHELKSKRVTLKPGSAELPNVQVHAETNLFQNPFDAKSNREDTLKHSLPLKCGSSAMNALERVPQTPVTHKSELGVRAPSFQVSQLCWLQVH